MKKFILILMSIGLLSATILAQNTLNGLGLESNISMEEKQFSCSPIPSAKPPAQHSSAEGIPPLPLPAVPLRRTEKKNPPRPPILIAKVVTVNKSDWATNPSDSENLLRWMAKNLNVHFSSINMPENQIPADGKSVPLLYRTGHDSFQFSEGARKQIRQYLLSGGTIIFDSCCGRKDFFLSAYKEAEMLIPERTPYRLNYDHPMYHSFFDINSVKYRPWALKSGAQNGVPSALGVDIGCRTAIFIFRWDLSCGWDKLEDSEKHHCLGYDIPTSEKIGANLMAYITAERNVSVPLSQALDFVDIDRQSSGKFTIGQVVYDGIWKTRETGLSMLLDSFHSQTKTPVRFERAEVRLDSSKIYDMPLLYMTGHNEFELNRMERDNLRNYIQKGGVVFAEACCGRCSFDESFRNEIKIIFGKDMEKIEQSSLFAYPNNLTSVSITPALSKNLGIVGKIKPILYGLKYEGTYSVIYSPYGLSCGWELAQCPYCNGLENKDALALGVNILSYAVLQ